MTSPLSFKTIHASVRPARVAVLVDKCDQDWQDTCLRVIEFFSRLWGGAYNLIIPTDGRTLDERFWTILEAFDPDRLYVYRKSGEDFRLSRPEQYEKKLDAYVQSYESQFGPGDTESVRKQLDKDLRSCWASDFAITPELQNGIKVRLSPFWFQEWIVEAGAISAGSEPPFPLTDLARIVMNTEHSDRFATISAPGASVPKLWFSAVCGSLNEKVAEGFKALGIHQNSFEFDENDIRPLMEFVMTGAIRQPLALPANERFFVQFAGTAPFELSMLQLGTGLRNTRTGQNRWSLLPGRRSKISACTIACRDFGNVWCGFFLQSRKRR